MAHAHVAAGEASLSTISRQDRRRVVAASSVGTIFEWYDFYLYAVLAPFFAALFFPAGNDTAALLSAFATYAAGFLVRPFGAIFFGRLGDLIGRKYTFLITVTLMGFSTFAVGLMPTYDQIGIYAPFLLVSLRLLQGLALGGEYGGAATYVAEHAPEGARGYATGFIQTTATLGFFFALIIIGLCQHKLTEAEFKAWGWRIPFLLSLVLLFFSIYVRLRLNESPIFRQMKAEGRGSKAPLTDSFLKYPNNMYVVLTLFGATAGQGVVWYTGQFYALFFLTLYLRLDYLTAYYLIGAALLIGAPLFIFFGWLSDKIGRLKIILAGCLMAAGTYFFLFQSLAVAINPALVEYQAQHPVILKTDVSTCQFIIFSTPFTRYSQCDLARNALTKAALSFRTVPAEPRAPTTVIIGAGPAITAHSADPWVWDTSDDKRIEEALLATNYPATIDYDRIDYPAALCILCIMLIYVAMAYGPIAAFLVEIFPARVRYTSLSLPYHIGNGWFGGILPFVATAWVASSGNIYYGLWYPVAVSAVTFVVGLLFLRDRMGRPPHD